MSKSYYHSIQISSRDADMNGYCRPSALLCHLQEAATQAVEADGLGRLALLEQWQAFWMMTRIWYHLKRPLVWEETLTIHTWHRGGRGAISYRDYDILCGEEVVGEAVAAWVLADRDTHQLKRLGEIPALQSGDGGALCKPIKLAKLHQPEQLTELERRTMRYSDLDINRHVNHTRYADFLCDALHIEQLNSSLFVSQLQLGYLAECHAGEELILSGAELLEGDQYLCGKDAAGKVRFEGSLRIETWRGEKQLCLK